MKIKTLLFSIIAFGLIQVLQAQVILKAEDMIGSGDTVRVSVATDNSIDVISTGAQVSWDFSYLTANSQRLERARTIQSGGAFANIQFGPAAGKYASDYFIDFLGLPIGQLTDFLPLPVNIDDIYRFVKIEEDSVSYTGLGLSVQGNTLPFRSDTIEVAYPLPLTYGDSYSSRGYTKINLNPFFDFQFIQKRQKFSEVDGWGSLKTPFGTFNAIRIHHIVEEQDSVFINFDNFSQWIPITQPTTHIYEWWTKFQDLPLLKIETREVGGNEVVTDIAYRDVYLGLDASVDQYSMELTKVYPNPAQHKVMIDSPMNLTKLELRSTDGKLVYFEELDGVNFAEIALDTFPAGVYFIQLYANEQSLNRKIVIQ